MLTCWTIVSLHLRNSKALSIHYRLLGQAILNKKLSFHYVKEKDCHDAIRALGRNKPIGPSNIPAYANKDSSSVIVPHLNFLVHQIILLPQMSLNEHMLYHKKDDPEEPNKYRPISITPCLSKIIETILRDQICQYLHDNKLLSKNQHGFRKNFSTIDSLLFFTEFIRNKTDIFCHSSISWPIKSFWFYQLWHFGYQVRQLRFWWELKKSLKKFRYKPPPIRHTTRLHIRWTNAS